MADFLYGVLFAASLASLLVGGLRWILERRRKPAFPTGLASSVTLSVILLGIACWNAKPDDYRLWGKITAAVFLLWAVLVATILYIRHKSRKHWD